MLKLIILAGIANRFGSKTWLGNTANLSNLFDCVLSYVLVDQIYTSFMKKEKDNDLCFKLIIIIKYFIYFK
jgi:hypothetical protein